MGGGDISQTEREILKKEKKRKAGWYSSAGKQELRGLKIYCSQHPDVPAEGEKSSWKCLQDDDLYQ